MERNAPRLQRPAYRKYARRPRGFRFWFWRLMRWGVVIAVLVVVGSLFFTWKVNQDTAPLIHNFDATDLPHRHVAMVFGAGLMRNGQPSPILHDRIATAVDLYKLGKVDKLLMTGDNSDKDYNEVEAMRLTAVNLGVPDTDIVLDYAGFSTYESCYRGRDVFNVRAATLVTNRYHLPRALHICGSLGIDAVGVPADRQDYATDYYSLREIPALIESQFLLISNSPPTFLGPPVNVDVPQRTPTP